MKEFIKRKKKDIILFLIPFLILILMMLTYYPGIIPYDGANQWGQVQSGIINNSHPFFSTYFMYLLSKLWNNPIIIIIFQVFIFSFFWMVMCNKTRTEKNYKRQIIYTILVSLVPIISLYSITLWKDVLYSYYLIMLGFMMYDIGIKKEFKQIKISEFIIIGLLLFLVFSYRHNGMLVAILYMLIFSITYLIKNKQSKKEFKKLGILFLTFVVLYGVFSIPKKMYLEKSSNNDTSESITAIDMYITWMFGNYIKEDVVSKKDLKFLDNIIDTDYWSDVYNGYLINQTFMPDEVNELFINKNNKKYHDLFFKYTQKYPNLLINHYLKSDALLISINSMDDKDNGYVYVYPFETWDYLTFNGIVYPKLPHLEKIYTKIVNITFVSPFKYFYQPGLIMYICIGLAIFIHKKYKNKKIWYILLPMFLNTTSLIVVNMAQDLRYTYINYLTLALIGLVWIGQKKLKNE